MKPTSQSELVDEAHSLMSKYTREISNRKFDKLVAGKAKDSSGTEILVSKTEAQRLKETKALLSLEKISTNTRVDAIVLRNWVAERIQEVQDLKQEQEEYIAQVKPEDVHSSMLSPTPVSLRATPRAPSTQFDQEKSHTNRSK
jgi:3-hydroxyacyl-CoA dehydrogenase